MGFFSPVLPTSPVSTSYAGFPTDMDDWNCEQWKQYYLKNKAVLGQEKAISIVNNDGYRIGVFASVHACAYDCTWASFMASEGLDPSNIFSMAFCSIKSTTQTATTIIGDAGVIATNITGATKSITSTPIMPIILLVGAGLIGYKLLK